MKKQTIIEVYFIDNEFISASTLSEFLPQAKL
jgi:hypothetical protein